MKRDWQVAIGRFGTLEVYRADIRSLERVAALLLAYALENRLVDASDECANDILFRNAAARYLSEARHRVYLLADATGMVTASMLEHPYLAPGVYIDNLFVSPEHRGIRPVCSLLYAVLMDARQAGFSLANGLFVREDCAFYERFAKKLTMYELRLQDGQS